MSKRPDSATLLYTGMGLSLALIIGASLWPDFRAMGLGLGVVMAFLSLAMQQILQRLAYEPAPDPALIDGLRALRESLNDLPAKVETGLAQGLREQGRALGESISQDLKAPSQALLVALKEMETRLSALNEGNAASLSALQRDLLKALENQGQALGRTAEAQQAGLTSRWQAHTEAWQSHADAWHRRAEEMQALGQAHGQKDREAWSRQLTGEFTALAEKFSQTLRDSWSEVTEKSRQALIEQAQEVFKASQADAETRFQSLDAAAQKVWERLQGAADGLGELEANQTRALEAGQDAVRQAAERASQLLAEQGEVHRQSAETLAHTAAEMLKMQTAFQEFEGAAQVSQVELQAGITMLNSALGNVLDRLENQAQSGESQEAFLGKLEAALAAYQERSGEILSENALKTQEILIEALQVLDPRPQSLMASAAEEA